MHYAVNCYLDKNTTKTIDFKDKDGQTRPHKKIENYTYWKSEDGGHQWTEFAGPLSISASADNLRFNVVDENDELAESSSVRVLYDPSPLQSNRNNESASYQGRGNFTGLPADREFWSCYLTSDNLRPVPAGQTEHMKFSVDVDGNEHFYLDPQMDIKP